MPSPSQPQDDSDAPRADQPGADVRTAHRGELIVEELVRADQAYWQRGASVDAMLAMVQRG